MAKSLHARLRAYEPFGGTLGLLPEPISFQASFLHDDDGALNVTYSRRALGGDILHRTLEQGLEIAVEVSDGGPYVEPANARFLVIGRQGDNLDDTDTISINSAPSISWLLSKILNNDTSHLIADGDNKGKRAFYSATAGTILKTFLDENRGRGGAASGLAMDFDTARDAGGDQWASEVTLYYSLGVSVQSALASLVGGSVVDWRTQGRSLRLWNADSAELSRDLSGTDVIHMHGGLQEAPYEESISGLASSILVEGDNGLVFKMDNPAAPKPWGAWESYVSQGGVSDEGTARAFMQHELEVAARVRGQYTRALNITDAEHLPLIDYAQGDWITAPTIGHGEKVRVQQITVGYSDGTYTASVVLNDKKYDAQVRNEKRIQGITGGATLAGSQGARPNTGNDHRTPKAPEGLTLASDAYLDSTGHARGLVSAVWGEVSQATDNTSIEISDYRVEWRYSDEGDKWRSAGVTSDERLSWSGLDCGRTVVVRVRAIPTYSDKLGEWSDEASVLVASDVTPPSVPSVPKLSSETSVVTISWDGLPATGAGMDADFDHCEVGRGLTSGSMSVVSASMTGRTQWVDTDVLPGAVWTYALRAVDHAGNKSAWSKTAQIEVIGAVSQEQIDKIQSDLQQAQSDLDKAEGTLDRVQSDLKGVESGLEQANRELDSVAADAADAVRQAQEAYEQATNAKKTADGLHNIFKGWQDPATMSGVIVKTGDFWYRTQQYWTTALGELDNSPSALANFYTYAQGEPDNSPSVLVPLESEVVEVLTWDGTRWNQFNLVASNVIASGSIVGDLIAANAITAGHLSAGSVTTDKLVSLAVTADKLAANSVTAGKIAANAVTTGTLAALAVTADKLAANSVTAGKIAAGAVTADKLAANSVTAGKIAAGTITSDKIAAGQFSGYVFTGAIFRTGGSDPKVEMNSQGLHVTDSSGTDLLRIGYGEPTGMLLADPYHEGEMIPLSKQVLSQPVFRTAGITPSRYNKNYSGGTWEDDTGWTFLDTQYATFRTGWSGKIVVDATSSLSISLYLEMRHDGSNLCAYTLTSEIQCGFEIYKGETLVKTASAIGMRLYQFVSCSTMPVGNEANAWVSDTANDSQNVNVMQQYDLDPFTEYRIRLCGKVRNTGKPGIINVGTPNVSNETRASASFSYSRYLVTPLG